MNYITGAVIVAIISAFIYGVFELLTHRKERLSMIEKMGSDINPELLKPQFSIKCSESGSRSYGALKIGGLLSGMGLGLLIAFCILAFSGDCISGDWIGNARGAREMLYGASVLLFGGLGLLVAFFIEIRMRKNESK